MENNRRFEIRTDLALEEKESFSEEAGQVKGVSVREWTDKKRKVKLTEVKIIDGQGAATMGKAVGTYITLEADQLAQKDEDYHSEVSEELGKQISNLIDLEGKEILVVGLGNPSVTPDALGPKVLGNLKVTRHLQSKPSGVPVLSGIVPGVMAQTGMETAEILRGIIKEAKPDLVIVIDALAARSVRRLGTTIQLTDTGIQPGSGVGNHRHSLTEESLGVPVLAIGVPTVVGAAAIVHDTVDTIIRTLAELTATKGTSEFIENMSPEEQYRFIKEMLEPEFGSLYVTPPNIDELIGMLSFTISEGIHHAVWG